MLGALKLAIRHSSEEKELGGHGDPLQPLLSPQSGDGSGGRVGAPGRRRLGPPVSLRKLRPRDLAGGGCGEGSTRPGRLHLPGPLRGGGPGCDLGASRVCPPRPPPPPSRLESDSARSEPGGSWPGAVVEAAALPVPRGQQSRASGAEPLGAAARRCARAPAFPAARPAPPAAPPRASRGKGGADRGRRPGRARTKVSPSP